MLLQDVQNKNFIVLCDRLLQTVQMAMKFEVFEAFLHEYCSESVCWSVFDLLGAKLVV